MLIKELRICDFLVFAGEQVIELPTEGESNLVVILAPNNTGKTNVIRALKFLFYGHLPDCTEATAWRLIHDGTRASAEVRSAVSGWVEVTLDIEGEELSLRRTIHAHKQGKNDWMHPRITLCRVTRLPKLRLELDPDGLYQTKLRTMVPEELFRGALLKDQRKQAARQKELDEVVAQFDQVTARLQELGSGGDSERLVAQLRELRTRLDTARRTRERADADIARLVGQSRGIPFLLGAIPMARRILIEMQEEDIIPATPCCTSLLARTPLAAPPRN